MNAVTNKGNSWWKRRVVEPLLGVLRQGLTPLGLALSLAAGAVIGVFPALGTTTALCVAAGTAFRLNHVALQVANYLVYPLQFILLIPFFKAAAWLFDYPVPVSSAAEVATMVAEDPGGAITALWGVGWRAMVVWCLAAPLAIAILFLPMKTAANRLASLANRDKNRIHDKN